MRKLLVLGLLVGLVSVFGTGCSTMSLKYLDQDLPENFLSPGPAGPTAQIVDAGTFWIPFVYGVRGRVYKVQPAYSAFRTTGLGPLGILMRTKLEARYSDIGQMYQYGRSSSLIFGFLFRARKGQHYTNLGWRASNGWSILLGAFGFTRHYDGRGVFRFAFIPLYSSRPEPGIKLLTN